VTKSRLKVGIATSIALLVAMEALVFLLGYAAFFAVGALSGGMTEGFRMASGALYSWFAFVLLGLFGWAVCMVILVISRRKQRGGSSPLPK
jgi:hypothetical protein